MTARPFVSALVASMLVCATSLAQPPSPAPPPTAPQPRTPSTAPAPLPGAPATAPVPPPGPPAPRREGQPVNIKVELSIVDQRGGAAASRKSVSVVVADGMVGFIRSTSNYMLSGGRIENVPLNVDVEPQLIGENRMRMRVNLQYDLPNSLATPAEGGERPGNLFTTQLRENLALILDSSKSIVAAQSADPVGDRQVTIEVKATVLR
jgi:hypothetical protein